MREIKCVIKKKSKGERKKKRNNGKRKIEGMKQ